MTQAQIEKMLSIAIGSDLIEFVESLEKQAAIDALKKAERTPSNDVKEEAENYAKGIATNYQEQILTQGQLRIYAKKDFIAGYLACAKKAERMEEVERKETIPTMDFHGWQINLKPTAHPYAGTMEFVAVNDGEMKSSDSLDELIDEVYEHYYGL